MKLYDELKAEMQAIQQQMVEAMTNERSNELKEVKGPRKGFGFTAGILNGSLAEARVTMTVFSFITTRQSNPSMVGSLA